MTDPDGTYRSLLRAAHRYRNGGLLPEAIAAYERLLALRPQSPNTWYNLARLQRQARHYEAALEAYQKALELGMDGPEEAHLNRGVIFTDHLYRYAEAEQELTAALRANPNYIPALFNLANLHEDLGRGEAARATYERILELEPRNLEALARHAQTHPPAETPDALIEVLHERLNDPSGDAAGRASVGFALGRALDGRGDHGTAFTTYVLANRLSRASAGTQFRPYDRATHERLIDRIIAAFAQPVRPPPDSPRTGPEPIFICGMYRSGSTLTEQLLARHPGVSAAGELDSVPQFAQQVLAPYPDGSAAATPQMLETLATQYSAHLAKIFPDARHVTDKRPDNFLYIGLIKRLFPSAKIVHTTRDPLDNCLSLFFLHLDPAMSYAHDLLDIGHYYGQYRRLMRHWQSLYGEDIIDVHYDTLVREPQAVLTRTLEGLGLAWHDACLQAPAQGGAVKTASVWQVRQPLYQHASGRSVHYRAQLASLRDMLATVTD